MKSDSPLMGDTRGLGLMQAVEFVTEEGEPNAALAAAVQQAAIAQNLLLLTCGSAGNVIRLVPALNVSSDEIAIGLERFERAVRIASGTGI